MVRGLSLRSALASRIHKKKKNVILYVVSFRKYGHVFIENGDFLIPHRFR